MNGPKHLKPWTSSPFSSRLHSAHLSPLYSRVVGLKLWHRCFTAAVAASLSDASFDELNDPKITMKRSNQLQSSQPVNHTTYLLVDDDGPSNVPLSSAPPPLSRAPILPPNNAFSCLVAFRKLLFALGATFVNELATTTF